MSELILPPLTHEMTFYAWVGVTQLLNGEASSYKISERLLGNGSAGTRLDFPSHLNSFCQNTANAFGLPIDIALKHTTLPFYLAFRPHSYINECVEIMCGDSVETLKFKLGIPPAHVAGTVALKYCPYCYQNDLNTIGIGFWHRLHQLPSSHYCSIHHSALEIIAFRNDGTNKNNIILPSLHQSKLNFKHRGASSQLQSISNISMSLLHESLPNGFNPKQLQYAYLHGLHQQGLLTQRGLVRTSELLNRLTQHFSELKKISPYEALLHPKNISNLLKLVRKPRGHHHSVAHVLLIEFLFGTWKLFKSVYAWESQFQLELNIEAQINKKEAITFSSDLLNISERYTLGESLNSLANEFYYDIGTLMRKLCKAGLVKVKRRPKKLTQEFESSVITLLKNGKSFAETQQLTNLSQSSIDRILSRNPEIKPIWQEKRLELFRDTKRETIKSFIMSHTDCCKGDLIKALRPTYNWLLNNDRIWLEGFLSKLNKKPVIRCIKTKHSRVDWSLRDQECLNALTQLGRFEPESWERVKPPMYIRRLNLSFKVRLDKLPLSHAWIINSLQNYKNDNN